MTKIVYNACYGGFGLSEAAYEKLIEWGVPVRGFVDQERGEVIFDRGQDDDTRALGGRYWDCWTSASRSHPLLVRVVEELGAKASGQFSELEIRELPSGTKYRIDEYDGREHVITIDEHEWEVA